MTDVAPAAGPAAERAVSAGDDASSATASVFEPTLPAVKRSRIRLALIAAAIGLWLLPWLGDKNGPAVTGSTAALGFLAAWGLGATALLSTTRRGLLVGEALTSAAIAATLAALVYARHPWLPGPDRTSTSLPIFLPLALLALLDAASRLRRPPLGSEVAAIRAGTALLCAAALFVALDPVPAIAAAFLAAAPASVAFAPRAKAARRAVEALGIVAVVALFLAQDAQRALTSAAAPRDQKATVWEFLCFLTVIAVAVITTWAFVSPESPTAADDGDADGADARPDERPAEMPVVESPPKPPADR